jgi:hypothetical protein
MTSVENFIADLADHPRFTTVASDFERMAQAIKREARRNRHARELLKAFLWIIRHDDRTLEERIGALDKLFALPRGPIVINMYELTGWI